MFATPGILQFDDAAFDALAGSHPERREIWTEFREYHSKYPVLLVVFYLIALLLRQQGHAQARADKIMDFIQIELALSEDRVVAIPGFGRSVVPDLPRRLIPCYARLVCWHDPSFQGYFAEPRGESAW